MAVRIGRCLLVVAALVGSGALARADDADPASARPGPALRAALALERADPAASRAALDAIEARFPIIADHAARQRLESLARAGDSATVLEQAASFRLQHPDSPLLGAVATREGEAAVALGDEPRARAAYAMAAERAPDGETKARRRAAIAASLERSGARDEAAGLWLTLWRDQAATSAASEAGAALERLSKETGKPLTSSADEARRCEVLAAAYWNSAALTACDAALAGKLSPSARRALHELRAEILFRDRRYPEAEKAFAALGHDRESRLWHARSLARSGRIDESKAELEALGAGRDALAARALFLAGTLYEDDDRTLAAERYRQALAKAQTAEVRIEAGWRLAWGAYRDARYAEAAEDLEALAADTADPIEALRARYWQARALERAQDPRGSDELAGLARDWGFTYYGWRAAGGASGVQGPPAARDVASAPSPSGVPALPPDAVERVRILLEAGLEADAASEARALAGRARQRDERLALAALLQDAGQFDAAQRMILDAYGLEVAAGPLGGPRDLWWAAYPEAFAPAVERAAQAHGIPRELLFAVMREESGFRPDALSVVGARGLVQIMPDTGARLAARLGSTSFSADELFAPSRNLELGAAYLAELLHEFEGRLSCAVAAYNAGPAAVRRWLDQGGQLADDEWVETIPYDQTRAYAKRVLRSVAAYQALY